MQRILHRTLAFAASPAAFALYLLALCLAAYGPFLSWLGFYWDDFPMAWIARTMGGAGLARYFSTNRPVWGLLYQVTTPLLGSHPLAWQVFALLLRWLSGLAFWLLLKQIWPKRGQLAAWSAALFVVYPGFSQQFISFVYSHFYIILICFLLSFSLMIQAIRNPQRYRLLTAAALLTSLINLLSMEYFFLFDLLRPLLAWLVLSDSIPDRRQRLARVLRTWLPYLVIFLGVVIWRSFFFGFHTYQPALVTQVKVQPLQAILALIGKALHDVSLATVGAWSQAFQIPGPQTRLFNPVRYWWVVSAAGLLSGLFLAIHNPEGKQRFRLWALQPFGGAILALFIAGGPFWLTNLSVGLTFASDRFTLPFMFGASLALASLVYILPVPNSIKAVLLAAGLAFAAGTQFQNAALYRQDWNTQRSLFWQMRWRIPALEPGTLLLSNELPILHYTDNSLSAPLNWIYDSDNSAPNREPPAMDYLLYYPTLRSDAWLTNPQKGTPIERDYLAATFQGSTDRVVVFYFNPPGCLRVLDPEIESDNWMVPAYLRGNLVFSTTAPILTSPPDGKDATILPAQLYGSEPAPSWCYYFEKADLARQAGDWHSVAQLGDQAFASGDYPNDPAERLPFIEGYAHLGNWERALEVSRETRAVSAVMQPALCHLWGRIERETVPNEQQQSTLKTIRAELDCSPGQ